MPDWLQEYETCDMLDNCKTLCASPLTAAQLDPSCVTKEALLSVSSLMEQQSDDDEDNGEDDDEDEDEDDEGREGY